MGFSLISPLGVFDSLLQQLIDQVFLGHTEVLHELGVNAFLSQSGGGADLVQQELALVGEEEVDASKTLAAQRLVSADSHAADLVLQLVRQISRDHQVVA